jgi:hypothetical protein
MWYSYRVHKPFYASGFLYHSTSHQILLQHLGNNNEDTKLVFFRGKSQNGNNPQTVFRQCVEDALGIPIPESSIHPVYDYVHDKLGEHFIFYVEVTDDKPVSYSSKNKTEWFSLSKLSKFNMSEQTRHDIVVGERVIRSLWEAANKPQNT